MKASRFVKAFEQDVDRWEKTLSQILEVVETLLQVQKQWMYLEVKLVFHCRLVYSIQHYII
jgi:dynein heavy chain